jgi:hypothetical protein
VEIHILQNGNDIISIVKIQESMDLGALRLKLREIDQKRGNLEFEDSLKKMIKNASKTSRKATTRKFLKSYLDEWKGSEQIFNDMNVIYDAKKDQSAENAIKQEWVDIFEFNLEKVANAKYAALKKAIESVYDTNSQLRKKCESDDPFRALFEKVNEYSGKLETDEDDRKARIRSKTFDDKKE